ncbi:hypothetical protein [Photobacterium proteolyticum]|nr:hypothetical protein [Photobacterium proteolyticum]
MTRRAKAIDPLTEHLKNLQPEQVDALEMMRGVYSNQASLGAAMLALHRHILETDDDVYGLASSVASNALPNLQAVAEDLEKQEL